MKVTKKMTIFLCIFTLGLTGSAFNGHALAEEPIVVEGNGVAYPESVIHDEMADLYLVSNFGSFPPDPANPGFISRVDPEGNVVDNDWIDGLMQPKGLAIYGDILYVADVYAVRLYDRRDASLLDIWPVPFEYNVNWLNDVAVGSDGTVYATDSGFGFGVCGSEDPMVPCPNEAMALYKFDDDGYPTVMAEGGSLYGPNGITTTGDSNLLVATFFSNEIYRTNSSEKIFPVTDEVPGFALDGLVRLTDNSLLVSSWSPPAIHMINSSRKEVTTILDNDNFSEHFVDFHGNPLFNLAPAGIGFDHSRNRILIPVLNSSKVIIYPME